jgi:dCMP deaminase|tara:strand:- start:60 stop:512 length:453 start_codon:yes stop_codon:yes gene_type:complete
MPNYKKFFKKILKDTEEMSTCARMRVASLIVKDGRIVSTGWNGVPSGKIHCRDFFHNRDVIRDMLGYADHHKFSEKNEIHAEQNAIGFASRNGLSTKDSDLYISVSPCIYCAKLIWAAGIKNVYYIEEYDRSIEGIEFLNENNIKCKELK